MSYAVVLREIGGPDKLRWEEWPVAKPGPGEVRLRHTAVGLNFIDIYQRSGVYPVPLPAVLGQEGAGVVIEAGPGVSLQPGTRVGYAGALGAYAEERIVAADRLVRLPDFLSDEDAAGVLLKGLTAEMLLRRVYPMKPGETILFTAAAGGVGQIACRWAKAMGATVIGTVGSAAKVETARAAGCDHVLIADAEGLAQLPARVRQISGGKGVPVAYDSVAGDSLRASLDSLAPRGLLVNFGQSSGAVPKIDLGELAKASLYVTRPTIRTYLADPAELQAAAAALFDALRAGHLRPEVRQRYPLREAGRAKADLAARRTTGTTALLVG